MPRWIFRRLNCNITAIGLGPAVSYASHRYLTAAYRINSAASRSYRYASRPDSPGGSIGRASFGALEAHCQPRPQIPLHRRLGVQPVSASRVAGAPVAPRPTREPARPCPLLPSAKERTNLRGARWSALVLSLGSPRLPASRRSEPLAAGRSASSPVERRDETVASPELTQGRMTAEVARTSVGACLVALITKPSGLRGRARWASSRALRESGLRWCPR